MNPVRSVFIPIILFFSFSHLALAEPVDLNHAKWDQLLKNYIHNGLVDYDALAQNRNLLDSYLEELQSYPIEQFSDLSREDRIAFWINLYNASVLQLILEEYPVQSVQDIPAFFEVRKIQAIGEFFSLSELRDKVLRNGFHDERILTALTSGRMDSPKILEEAFTGSKIESQLNETAFRFVSDESRNKINPKEKKIYLSQLFREYGEDFMINFSDSKNGPFSEGETAVISFILHHLKDPDQRLYLDSTHYKIKYLPEDSRLNAVSNSKVHH